MGGALAVLYGMCNCLFVGMYADDDCPDDSKLFICERHAFVDLLDGLKTPCSCGMSSHPWVLDSFVQVRYYLCLWYRTIVVLSSDDKE